MKVHVKLFAILKDAARTGSIDIELNDDARVADVVKAIETQFPAVAPFLPRVACAVNREYAGRDQILHDGDEVALIPPVSGG